MCGIVGGVSKGPNVVPFLVQGLSALEYRGYDSVGVAIQTSSGQERFRTNQRVSHLREMLGSSLASTCGIGHTRWATHGAPEVRNAHPHSSGGGADDNVMVVHNGIIENHEELRAFLREKGYVFESDTDTEVIAHLLHFHFKHYRNFGSAFRATRKELKGLFAFAAISKAHSNVIYATRKGAPLLLGVASDGNYLASDVSALLAKTNKVVYLEDGDVAVITSDSWRVESSGGESVLHRAVVLSELNRTDVELGYYQHYMQKEIFEQPKVLADALQHAEKDNEFVEHIFGASSSEVFRGIKQVLILACGTSYHAGLVAKHWIESTAKIPCVAEIASEFRYRDPIVQDNTLVVSISQSGETADTRAAVEHAVEFPGAVHLSICNVPESALSRMAALTYLTRAGAEVGVASTKAFTAQLVAGRLLAISLARSRGISLSDAELKPLRSVPAMISAALSQQTVLRRWAEGLARSKNALFLGRGLLYPIAMEGALKLKEISYIHAEAYSAGELKHGPLALVDENMPVIVSVSKDSLLDKVKANIEEVLARKGEVFAIVDPGCDIAPRKGLHVLELVNSHSAVLSPLVHVVPLQLLAYYTSLELGTDVDKPRNLAKSVTVE